MRDRCLIMQTMDAKPLSVDTQVMSDEATARKRINAWQEIIDGANAKLIIAESGVRMADVVAKGDKTVAAQSMERARHEREEADRR